ncbi:MAG: CoA pyrophosphatase [Fulvivirga sp.]|uniref:NUDIX hydrolase n=1 Tax=Fulvivirga sp. TaxID=1931237 RepID=UPI0032EB9276
MKLNELVDKLEAKLVGPLPGPEAHRLMMPGEINTSRFDKEKMAKARLSGVLILFYEKNGEAFIPLTQRHEYGGTHSGQISFPGGKWEETDPDLIYTAKREANEEIGVLYEEVNVIGQLSDLFIPPSNFKVTPVVSFTENQPQFEIDTYEVKELIEVPVSHLIEETTVKQTVITFANGYTLNTPYFDVEGRIVWGATAMMLSELKSIIIS